MTLLSRGLIGNMAPFSKAWRVKLHGYDVIVRNIADISVNSRGLIL